MKNNGFAKYRINKGFYGDVHTYECSKSGCGRQIRVTENMIPHFFHFEENQEPHDTTAHTDLDRPRGMSLRQKIIVDKCLNEYNRSQTKFIAIQINQYNETVPPSERVPVPSRNSIRNYVNYQKTSKKKKKEGDHGSSSHIV